jgi:hypothetical protein
LQRYKVAEISQLSADYQMLQCRDLEGIVGFSWQVAPVSMLSSLRVSPSHALSRAPSAKGELGSERSWLTPKEESIVGAAKYNYLLN